jgi:cysteinyl-tRNA synthetase
MSKSVGNIALLGEALDEVGPEVLVMYFVGAHYRSPTPYSPAELDQARGRLGRIRDLIRRLDPDAPAGDAGIEPFAERFFAALANDFNTPRALSELFGWIAEANRLLDDGARLGVPPELREMLHVLGLDSLLAEEDAPDEDALRLLDEREAARSERDFATADARRDELAARGWEVRDTPEGPRLVRAG